MTAIGSAIGSAVARPVREHAARLRLVPPATRRSRGWQATVLMCVVGFFAALVMSVAIQGQRIALQEQADRIAHRTAQARDRNRSLRIEVIQAESPEQVLGAARSAGLVDPGPVALIPAVVITPPGT